MRNPIGRVCEGRASLLAGVAASVAALLGVSSLTPLSAAPAGDEVFVSAGHVNVPGNPLAAFDISWIDPNLVEYFLADRSNAAVEVIPLILNPPVFPIKPTGVNAFAGAAAGGNDFSGPNGIITFNDPLSPGNPGIQLWVGDGPTNHPSCGVALPCSTVKVFTDNGTLSAVIPTGQPGLPSGSNTVGRGNARADELCVAPPQGSLQPGLVMIANDADTPFPFLSIIPTDTNGGVTPNVVSQKIVIPFALGIEQCQWDGSTGTFYVNLPATTNGSGNGAVITFARGATAGTVVFTGFFDINNGNCVTPQGMAIGPRQGGSNGFGNPFNSDILLGCNRPGNSVTVWKLAPNFLTNIYVGAGGADEVWFNSLAPGNSQGHYFIASGTPTPAGGPMFVSVIDPLFGPAVQTQTAPTGFDQTIPTGFRGSAGNSNHSVAAWSGTPGAGTPNALPLLEVVAIPIISTQGSPTASQSTVCGADAAKGCVAFFVISPPATFPDNNAPQNF